ncbi:MAG: hypothetical protein IKO72_09805 [Kiritimatiellae bacterium]|nr:hypothetical protein [Kiritimatiellia bacterium]
MTTMKVCLTSVLVLGAFAAAAGDVVLETEDFRLVAGDDARVKSLVVKATGEECVDPGQETAIFTATQDRPFNNEIKLIHPNKRTVYPACSLRKEGDLLIAGFAHRQYEAKVAVKRGDGYLAFELVDFACDRPTTYDHLKMDIPPVASFRALQLPVKNRLNFGDWLNASWDDRAAVGVVGTSPYPDIDHEDRVGSKILFGELYAGLKLRGASVALIAVPGREAFLDAMDALERDYGLPRGVKSRRGPASQESIFHLSGDFTPDRVDEAIEYARKGGFRLMTFAQYNITVEKGSWSLFGNYDWREDSFPNHEADLKALLARIKAAGIAPGLHTLHSHIGLRSRYVTPVADPRLNKTRRFTLARTIGTETNLDEIAVYEPTADAPMFPACRILQFGGELVSYESYTTEQPYRFLGIRRGAHDTRITAHPKGEIGGILDVSEYGTPLSCYADQNTDLPEEVSAKIANIYNCGFEYVYLDGSEGVNRPCNFHVANAQYRYWRMLKPEPLFGEAAAKTHFGWHMLAGANAFDVFPAAVFKAKLREYPFHQAPITQQDMTRVDFGWWAFVPPKSPKAYGGDLGTQADMWEYGISVATAWNCASTIRMPLNALKKHPRTDDILETMRRWADLRRRGLMTDKWRAALKDYGQEHHLLLLADGTYDLVDYDEVKVGDGRTPVRAFAFERDGSTWLVYWHGAGSGTIELPVDAGKLALFGEYARDPVQFEKTDGGARLPVDGRRYLKAAMPRAELVQALSRASVSTR